MTASGGSRRERIGSSDRPIADEGDLHRAFVAYGAELTGLARRVLGNHHLAEEAVQETFARAWRARERFDAGVGSMRAWLFSIERNLLVDLLRERARRRPIDERTSGEERAADDEVDGAILTWQLEEAIRHLSDDHAAGAARGVLRRTDQPRGGGSAGRRGRHRAEPSLLRPQVASVLPRPERMGAVSPFACTAWRGRLAMASVGRLQPDEADAVTTHVSRCAACRAEADQLADVVGLLDSVGDAALRVVAGPLDGSGSSGAGLGPGELGKSLGARLEDRGHGVRGGKVARRVLLGAGAAAACVALVVAVATGSGGPVAPSATRVALRGGGVAAAVTLSPGPSFGTRAVLAESGQAAGGPYTVTMVSSDGYRWVSGSYLGRSGSGVVRAVLTCPVEPGQIRQIWVTDPSGKTVLRGTA